jgi:membrane protein required for colicin V production
MVMWNWLDWLLAAIVVASVIAALRKGFLAELIALATLVAGLVVAALGYSRASSWFEDLTRSHQVALAAGFLALFLGTLAVGGLISALARRLMRAAGVEWFDRFLGAIFGLVRGVLLDSILLMVLVAFAIKTAAIEHSQLAPYVSAGARAIAVVMPKDLKTQFRAGFERFRQAVARNLKN